MFISEHFSEKNIVFITYFSRRCDGVLMDVHLGLFKIDYRLVWNYMSSWDVNLREIFKCLCYFVAVNIQVKG